MTLTKITSKSIKDNEIVNADLHSAAAIASTKLAKPIDLADDEKIRMGTGNDFEIFHQASNGNSIIRETGGGNLSIQTNGTNLNFYDSANDATLASFITGGATNLFHSGTKRFETTSTGVDVTGSLGINTTASAPLHIQKSGTSQNLAIFESDLGTNNNRTLIIGSPTSDSGSEPFRFTTGNSIQFRIDSTDALTITDSARIGIGTSSPDKPFEIRTETASHEIFAINRPATGTAALYLGNDSSNNALISANNSNLILGKDLSGTFSEYMRIDTSGNVSVASGNLTLTSGNAVINNATGGNALTINLADAATDSIQINGGANQARTILRMQQGNSNSDSNTGYRIARADGTDVMNLKVDHHHNYIDLMNLVQSGHIRFFTSSSENSNGSVNVVSITSRGSLQGTGDGFARPAFSFTNDTDSGMYRRGTNNIGFATAGAERYFMGNSALGPVQDNAKDLGTASNRWDDVRATNGNIVTSDKNEKNTIVASDLGLDFINKLTPVSYKYNNKTRTHYGLIAQDVETLLGTLSKSATDFAGFCKDTVTTDQDDKPLETPVDRYGLRYTEFISPIIKAIQELSTKVAALEAK